MAKKQELRKQRVGTVINTRSKIQEKSLDIAISGVRDRLREKFPGVEFDHERQWLLKSVVEGLSQAFPDVDFFCAHASSAMRPDGGILSLVSADKKKYPILIAEKKNQGTNDLRAAEGKGKQAKGNAIERLGKNAIGFRTAMLEQSIFPFVCFGDGCDFAANSSILDRVVTIAMFGQLNKEYLHNSCSDRFNRGSFFFRERVWSGDEMKERCYSIAEKSVYYYFSKYGEGQFK
ncbi:MAG: type II restriction endonuclease [Xanthomonadales bacterium]|nr:type II restriction endonuclease [Xanthomonadales bacterium]